LGITNSWAVNDLFEGRIVFNGDVTKMLDESLQRKEDYKFIQEQMEFVKKEHTYINRVKSLLSIL
jgi:ubiquinone biosynthesis protein COQ9